MPSSKGAATVPSPTGSNIDRPAEQAKRRGNVARFIARTPASPAEARASSASARRAPIRLAELRPQPVRLLEVVADELVELGEIGRLRVEPVGVALVQLRSQALRR